MKHAKCVIVDVFSMVFISITAITLDQWFLNGVRCPLEIFGGHQEAAEACKLHVVESTIFEITIFVRFHWPEHTNFS